MSKLYYLVVLCCVLLTAVFFMIAKQHDVDIHPYRLLSINGDLRHEVNSKNFQGVLDTTEHQGFTVQDSKCEDLKFPNVANLETDWLKVSRDDLAFVYSAYRETNGIRVIGLAELKARQNLGLYCQIWARDMSYNVVLFHVRASIFVLPESHYLR